MVECDYCDASFEDGDAYTEHLASTHRDELGPIDRRRVEGATEDEGGGFPTGPVILGGIVVGFLALTGYLVLTTGGSGADGPHSPGTVHIHGQLNVTIGGEHLDVTSPEFAGRDDHFHIHPRQDEPIWHVHSQGVTLQYALGTLGIEVNDDGTVLSYDGETYRADDSGTSVVIEVDGEPVEPGSYELQGVGEPAAERGEGDNVRVAVETDG